MQYRPFDILFAYIKLQTLKNPSDESVKSENKSKLNINMEEQI